MKRIAIISLLAVFLITNYAYATLTSEDLAQGVEKAQQGELTQEEAEELYVALIFSIDWEAVAEGDLSSIESIQPNLSTGCTVLLVISTLITIFYPPLAAVFAALFAFFCGD